MPATNTVLSPTRIAREMLLATVNSMTASKHINTQYKNEFVKAGQTITIRKPNKFRTTLATTRSANNVTEPSTSITINSHPAQTSWEFSSRDLTLSIEDYNKRYAEPAGLSNANFIDSYVCALYKDVYNSVGTPGTTPSTFSVLGNAQARLDKEAVPSSGRVGILDPDANWALADGLKGTFAQNVASNIITKGYLGTIANLSLYMDQNIATHTCGHFTSGATPVVNGTMSVEGATTIVTNGWASGTNTIKQGDVFTIANVYAVNPMSGASTGELRQFVVTADLTNAATTTNMTIACSPAVITTGPYQTVDSFPQDGAALTFMGTEDAQYTQNLIFHPDAFGLVTVPIEMPTNTWGARVTDKEAGISALLTRQWSIESMIDAARLDTLFGVKTFYPEFAVRVWGA